jgi:secreted trypsin-like serine protease
MKLITAISVLFTASIWIQDTLASPQMTTLHPRGFHGDDDPIGIVGGEPVGTSSKYPWIATLQLPKFGHFCGGSLIAKNLVLTAAHCVAVIDSFSVSARRYDISTTSKEEGGIDFNVIKKIVHPKFGQNVFVSFDVFKAWFIS